MQTSLFCAGVNVASATESTSSIELWAELDEDDAGLGGDSDIVVFF